MGRKRKFKNLSSLMTGGESELQFPDAFDSTSLSVVSTLSNVGSPSQMFFCNLCSARCYDDTELHNHLIDKLHSKKLAIAKTTLLKSNPWPFKDGVNFFYDSPELENKPLPVPNSDLGLIIVNDTLMTTKIEHKGLDSSSGVNVDCDLVISKILHRGKVLDLGLDFVGYGQICARFLEFNNVQKGIKRMWCEWLGKTDDENTYTVEKHDFAVIVFGYYDHLGRNVEHFKSISDSSVEKKSKPENSSSSSSLIEGTESPLLQSRLKEIFRRKYLVAGEELCNICQLKMVPGTSVAALLNTKTGSLCCSSKSYVGEFHVFHISCLIHWILICEYEIWGKKLPVAVVRRSTRGKRDMDKQISCVFCPDCHGTGIETEKNQLEKSTVPLYEVVDHKLKMGEAVKNWITSPEEMQKCSTGLLFKSKAGETFQEKVSSLKLLRFYRVKE